MRATTQQRSRPRARWLAWPGLAALLLASAASASPPVAGVRVAVGLVQPLAAVSPPGDTARLFVVEQRGTIRILDTSLEPPILLAGNFLDIQELVETEAGNEQGLLGLAFHPDFATNRRFFVSYTMLGGDVRISRFEVPIGTPNDADETSEVPLLTIDKPQANHNGGWLAFGPADGYLYLSVGDGGGAGDTGTGHTPGLGNAQDITANLLGKILRIDVDGTDGPGGNYGIPPSNPFVGVTGDDEIWAYGLRNPWRNAFDRVTGNLFIADVGQAAWEEIDFQPGTSPGGENWGWRCREGAHDFNNTGACPTATLLDPIQEYSQVGPPERCAITGGEVYRGTAIPGLQGTYFYADFCSGEIWSLEVEDGVATNVIERTQQLDPPQYDIARISSFGVDAEGEIYIMDRSGGEVFKIVPGAETVPGLAPHGVVTIVLALLCAASLALRSAPAHRRSHA